MEIQTWYLLGWTDSYSARITVKYFNQDGLLRAQLKSEIACQNSASFYTGVTSAAEVQQYGTYLNYKVLIVNEIPEYFYSGEQLP